MAVLVVGVAAKGGRKGILSRCLTLWRMQALRDFAAQDPVVTTGTTAFEAGRMAAGHVRGR